MGAVQDRDIALYGINNQGITVWYVVDQKQSYILGLNICDKGVLWKLHV
jgi:hypothetical protein